MDRKEPKKDRQEKTRPLEVKPTIRQLALKAHSLGLKVAAYKAPERSKI